jgi:hypothetical protein
MVAVIAATTSALVRRSASNATQPVIPHIAPA